jgi:hypothetical protein
MGPSFHIGDAMSTSPGPTGKHTAAEAERPNVAELHGAITARKWSFSPELGIVRQLAGGHPTCSSVRRERQEGSLRPELIETLRMKAVRIPREAYRDDDTIPNGMPNGMPISSRSLGRCANHGTTVRARPIGPDAPTVVVRRERLDLRLTVQIWGLAAVLVAVMVVLFR